MITLFGIPASASTAPRICLEEAGAEYEFVAITRDPVGPPAFVAASPHGKVPAMVDGALRLSESAAITMHLSDRFPQARLAPAPSDPLRADWYRWLILLTATIQTPIYQMIYPQRFAADRLMVGRVRNVAERALSERLDWLEGELTERDHLVGDTVTSADIFLWMLIPWTRHMVEPAFTRPATRAYWERIGERPAVARVVELEGIV